MRKLFPGPDGELDLADLVDLYEPSRTSPAVRLNMVASVDGAASAEGRSGGLGGPADRQLFQVLRSLADVVLVGAGTWRTERYGPARLSPEARVRRADRGLAPVPPIAVVTASCRLDWERAFFTEAEPRPVVVTVAGAGAEDRAAAEKVADVIVAGDSTVDLRAAVAGLAERGYRHVLCEGGPRLGVQLADEGLLDDLCLTVSPLLVGGEAFRILNGPPLDPLVPLSLVHVLEQDGFLFLRYARTGAGDSGPS